jgi:hypothetical protein
LPVELRFLLPLVPLLLCFGFALWEWQNVHDDRCLRGALLLGRGGLVGCLSIWPF